MARSTATDGQYDFRAKRKAAEMTRLSGRMIAGSPNVNEIELNHVLTNEWPNVVKWLKNFDLLRSVELERLILRV